MHGAAVGVTLVWCSTFTFTRDQSCAQERGFRFDTKPTKSTAASFGRNRILSSLDVVIMGSSALQCSLVMMFTSCTIVFGQGNRDAILISQPKNVALMTPFFCLLIFDENNAATNETITSATPDYGRILNCDVWLYVTCGIAGLVIISLTTALCYCAIRANKLKKKVRQFQDIDAIPMQPFPPTPTAVQARLEVEREISGMNFIEDQQPHRPASVVNMPRDRHDPARAQSPLGGNVYVDNATPASRNYLLPNGHTPGRPSSQQELHPRRTVYPDERQSVRPRSQYDDEMRPYWNNPAVRKHQSRLDVETASSKIARPRLVNGDRQKTRSIPDLGRIDEQEFGRDRRGGGRETSAQDRDRKRPTGMDQGWTYLQQPSKGFGPNDVQGRPRRTFKEAGARSASADELEERSHRRTRSPDPVVPGDRNWSARPAQRQTNGY